MTRKEAPLLGGEGRGLPSSQEHENMAEANTTLWSIEEVSKAFPGVQALDRVSLALKRGEIHALVGENGSGKSTLAKCLSGAHQPDSGRLVRAGQPVSMHHPLDAQSQGVAIIYQEFSLVPTLSVTENIFLGRPHAQGRIRMVNWNSMRQDTLQLLDQLSIEIDPDAMVRDLSVAEQQLVEIIKAMSLESSLLIMDEPTAALGLAETRRLLDLIRRLAQSGQAILYISHRLDEVFEIADRISVLKDGQLVGTSPTDEVTINEVVRMMVGRDIEQHYPKQRNSQPELCLQVSRVSTEKGVRDVSFDIQIGEVFGLGGMVGSGRTEIARALYGLDPPTSGEVRLYGESVRFSSPRDAIRRGVGLVPENRKADGLMFNFSAPPNITISRLGRIVNGGFLRLRVEREAAEEYVSKLSITRTALERSVQFLSGGNQQKVIIARWLFSQAKLLILDEPTQGVDIGAKLEVYHVINELTQNGISILLISSDYPELLAMSDRVAVVRDGGILHVGDARDLTEYRLLSIASGAEGNHNSGFLSARDRSSE